MGCCESKRRHKMERQIVQISACFVVDVRAECIVALCSDSTVWYMYGQPHSEEWVSLPSIPQPHTEMNLTNKALAEAVDGAAGRADG